MSSLTLFQQDGIEVYIDMTSGESFPSVRGYSRMVGKAQSTIQSRIDRMPKSERNLLTKMAETPTGKGLDSERILREVRLISEDLMCEWLPKDNPEMATKVMKLGIRHLMHELAGYKVTSTAIVQPVSEVEKLEKLFLTQVTEQPAHWQLRFIKPFWLNLENVYGLKQGDRGCAPFINTYIYSVFPRIVVQKLNEVNPINDDGTRSNRIHQHLNKTFIAVLEWQLQRIITLLETSRNVEDFKDRFDILPKHKFFQSYAKHLEDMEHINNYLLDTDD